MYPVLDASGVSFQLSELQFFLLVFSTMLIAAAGYAINDYFDTRIDRVNKPDRVVIDNTINRRTAMLLHVVMNLVAIAIGLYLGWVTGKMKYALVQPAAASALWFYSVDLKHRFLAGNLVIAALAFLVPFLPALYEIPLLEIQFEKYGLQISNLLYINYLVLGYAVFAFLSNLLREIIKDLEDEEGDSLYGSKTLPITIGEVPSKLVSGVIGLLIVVLLAKNIMYPQISEDEKDYLSFLYFLLAVQLPLLTVLILLIFAKTKKHYSRLSILTKVVMLGGILSMPMFYYTVMKTISS